MKAITPLASVAAAMISAAFLFSSNSLSVAAPASGSSGSVSLKDSMADAVLTIAEEGEVYYDVLTQGSFTCRGKVAIATGFASTLSAETVVTLVVGGWLFETELGSNGNFRPGSKSFRFKLPTGATVRLNFAKTTLTWTVSGRTGSVYKGGDYEELEASPVAEDFFQNETFNIAAEDEAFADFSLELGVLYVEAQIPITGSATYIEKTVGAGDYAEEFGLNSVKVSGSASISTSE